METDGEISYKPCSGCILAINSSLKEVMLYLSDLFNGQNPNVSQTDKAESTYGQQ